MAVVSRKEGKHVWDTLVTKSPIMRSPFRIKNKNSGDEVCIYVVDMPPPVAIDVPEGSVALNPNAEEAIGMAMISIDDSWRTLVGAVIEAYEGQKDILAASLATFDVAWNSSSGTTLGGALTAITTALDTATTDVSTVVSWSDSMPELTTSGLDAEEYPVDVVITGDNDASEVTLENFVVTVNFLEN